MGWNWTKPAEGSVGPGAMVATAAGLLLGCLSSCGGGGGSSGGGAGQTGVVGEESVAPDGHLFLVDPNQSGAATRLRVAEMFWGRLVDVHDVDALGVPSAQPLYRDLAVNENTISDGANYLLDTNPVTQQVRLIIRRTRGAPDTGSGTFLDLLRAASESLPAVLPKHDDGSSAAPFSFMARNACLVIRFDDLLDDSEAAARNLPATVQVLTGYPPTSPFSSRLLFDENHGAIVSGRFHSTRVLVDVTVSAAETATMLVPQPLNALGLPVSLETSLQPNVSVRMPTRVDFGGGQFELLTNLKGSPLTTSQNGPFDATSPTGDIVRALRSGNSTDTNNGFLLDLNQPQLLGSWPVTIDSAGADPAGLADVDFLANVTFATVCATAPDAGDILTVGDRFFEVTARAVQPDTGGRVAGVRLSALAGSAASPSDLLGSGEFVTTYGVSKVADTACWVTFAPQPELFPAGGVAVDSQVVIRFSEPMDPATVSPFETFLLVRGPAGSAVKHNNIVVGTVTSSGDVREFVYTPTLPLPNEQLSDEFTFQLGAFADLAGNTLVDQPGLVRFTVDEEQPVTRNGGLTLRFNTPDEVEPNQGLVDLRGQFFYDLDRGRIQPRPVSFQSYSADRGNPVPSIMVPFPPGVQTPLSPLGSKLHSVWRFADLGWQVRDETKYNVDVYGLNWSPIGGQVVNDFYEEFEIRLAHSFRQPDECISTSSLLPRWPNSGLTAFPGKYRDNVLQDPLSPQKIVHPRSLGYQVSAADLFAGVSGTLLVPFPMNRGAGPLTTYTWRDTAVLARGANGAQGIPLCIQVGPPLFIENPPAGNVAPSGQVPSFGLPLLMEYRCYPSDSGVGLNAFDISLAINSSARPNFRSYSTGGLNRLGQVITKNPDLEDGPTGGFNPGSSPPGKKTKFSADNSFYIGQVDIVIRVSRVHSIWLDSGAAAPDYLPPVLEPNGSDQPPGAQVILEYRGASGFSTDAGMAPFDAMQLDPYGEIATTGTVNFQGGIDTWASSIDQVDGARYLQVRMSFINNIETGLNADLDALGIPFDLP